VRIPSAHSSPLEELIVKSNCAFMAILVASDEICGFTKEEIANLNELSLAGVHRIRERDDYPLIRDAVLAVFVDEVARSRARSLVDETDLGEE